MRTGGVGGEGMKGIDRTENTEAGMVGVPLHTTAAHAESVAPT